MTTYGQIKSLVYAGLGRDVTDEATALIVPYAVNWAVKAAAVIFRPKELANITSVSILSGNSYVAFDYNFIDIISVIGSWGDELHFVPLEGFRSLVTFVSSSPRYYTTFGKYIIVNISSSVGTTYNVYWLKLPDDLSADADVIPFYGHDAFIVSLACGISFAMFEEGETVDIWAKVGDILGMSMLQRTKMQEIVMGVPTSLEAQITGAIAGSK